MEDEIDSLKRRADIVRRKLQILQEEAAHFAAGERPARLLIQIGETEKELMEIEGQIKMLEKRKRVNVSYNESEARQLKDEVRKLFEQAQELKRGTSELEEGPKEVSKTIVAFFSVLLSIITTIIINLITKDSSYTMYGFLATLIFCGFTFGVFTKIVIDKKGKISIERR